MYTILKDRAFREIVILLKKGDHENAQKMLRIISRTIKEEKAKGIITNDVILHDQNEERIFKHLIKPS